MNVKWQKIINLYKDQNNHYWDYELEQYEILNNLFKNVETVKCIGGGPNLDFFIAQYGNNVKECVNIDKDLFYRNFNTLSLQDQYKDLFSYKGNYDFICTDAKNIPVFDKPYDCVIDNVGPEFELDYTLTNPPKMYIINHYRHIEYWDWCMQFDKIIPMQFATRHSCVYSFDFIEPINEIFPINRKTMKVNNRIVPVIQKISNDIRRTKENSI